MDTRSGHPLFAGAKVTVGSIPLNGKNFEDFSSEEVAYLVGRYMVQRAEGNSFVGSVPAILAAMWPFELEGKSISELKITKRIYYVLKLWGFRPWTSNQGVKGWYVPKSFDEVSSQTLAERKVIVKDREHSPVTYRCGFCGVTFDTSPKLKAHLIDHAPVIEEGDKKDENMSIESHDNRTCDICGKEVSSGQGLGAHKRSHAMSHFQKELFDAVKTMENMTVKEYATLLDTTTSAIEARARRLAEKGILVRTMDKHLVLASSMPKAPEAAAKKRFVPKAAKPAPVQSPAPAVAGELPEISGSKAQVFETSDGKLIVVKESGEVYILPLTAATKVG